VVQAIRPTKTSSSWLAAAAAANVKRTLLTLLWVLPPRLFFWLLFGLGVVCAVKSADVLCYSSLHFHYDTLLTYLLTYLLLVVAGSILPELISPRYRYFGFLLLSS